MGDGFTKMLFPAANAGPDIPEMEYIISHKNINAINFTGGSRTALAISAKSEYKKLLFELGGNDALIVMDDGNVDAAVQATINQRIATAGQRCTAAKRIFVHTSVYEDFKTKLVEKVSTLKVGDPKEDDTFIGTVVNESAAQEIMSRIQSAESEGAHILLKSKQYGATITPCIIENVPVSNILVKEETFGPVVPLHAFDEVKDIVDIINDTPYGLQGGVFTNNMEIIKFLFDNLDLGTLAVNDGPGFRAEHFPFGGVKESGIAREGIKYAIREMSIIKTLVL